MRRRMSCSISTPKTPGYFAGHFQWHRQGTETDNHVSRGKFDEDMFHLAVSNMSTGSVAAYIFMILHINMEYHWPKWYVDIEYPASIYSNTRSKIDRQFVTSDLITCAIQLRNASGEYE